MMPRQMPSAIFASQPALDAHRRPPAAGQRGPRHRGPGRASGPNRRQRKQDRFGPPRPHRRVTPGRDYVTRYTASSGRGRSRRGRTAVASPPPPIFSSSRRPAWPEWWPPRRPRDDTSGHSRVSRILTGTSGRLAGDRSSPLGGWGLGFDFPSSRCFALCCRCARRRRGRQGTGRATAIQRAIRAIRERAVRRGGRQR